MSIGVVYFETCAYEQGTLKRPGVGALRGIVETSMGRAWLAQLAPAERIRFLARAKLERPEIYSHSIGGAKESVANYATRGFAINMGDAGFGVHAVGVASRVRYGPRTLLFNCAMPGYRGKQTVMLTMVGPALVELVNFAGRQSGVR